MNICNALTLSTLYVFSLSFAEEGGQLKFEPLYKRCVVDQIPPHLQLSYKNVSVVSTIP